MPLRIRTLAILVLAFGVHTWLYVVLVLRRSDCHMDFAEELSFASRVVAVAFLPISLSVIVFASRARSAIARFAGTLTTAVLAWLCWLLLVAAIGPRGTWVWPEVFSYLLPSLLLALSAHLAYLAGVQRRVRP